MVYDSVTEEKFKNSYGLIEMRHQLWICNNSAVKRNGEWQKWTYAQYLEETREEKTQFILFFFNFVVVCVYFAVYSFKSFFLGDESSPSPSPSPSPQGKNTKPNNWKTSVSDPDSGSGTVPYFFDPRIRYP
jgi:hypothetical protein